MSVYLILYVLFSHWVCDFLLQTDKQATNKSKSIKYLVFHTLTYSIGMLILIETAIYFGFFGAQYWYGSLLFSAAIFISHTFIDYFTSKITSRLWERKNVRKFFDTIGFDQWLHYATIFLTIDYLFY